MDGPLTKIVEGIQHDIELTEPQDVVLRFFDVPMNRGNLDVGVERTSCLGCYLMNH